MKTLARKLYALLHPLAGRISVRCFEIKYSILSILSFSGRKSGVRQIKRDIPLVVSLTTYSKRINKVYLVIESIMRQSLKPDHIVLWLSNSPRERVPVMLERLKKRGLQIKFCNDIRSFKKIIYTLGEFPDSPIVTADDDCIYPRDWLKELYDSYMVDPGSVSCHRAHMIRLDSDGQLLGYDEWENSYCSSTEPFFRLFPTGVGGILYPPGAFTSEVFNSKIYLSLCPLADDVWLKAMALLNGVPCRKATARNNKLILVTGSQTESLYQQNVSKKKNDEQFLAVIRHYELLPFIQANE